MDAASGFTIGLVAAAFLLGLRHGIDWDHIVAISDIAATQESKRRGVFVGTLYVVGHASVIILLGIGAIALGATVPDWLDAVAGRVSSSLRQGKITDTSSWAPSRLCGVSD